MSEADKFCIIIVVVFVGPMVLLMLANLLDPSSFSGPESEHGDPDYEQEDVAEPSSRCMYSDNIVPLPPPPPPQQRIVVVNKYESPYSHLPGDCGFGPGY